MATSSIAPKNAASFAFDGVLKPLIFLTNCSEAARISASVTGGSKLNRVLMFLHISLHLLRFLIGQIDKNSRHVFSFSARPIRGYVPRVLI